MKRQKPKYKVGSLVKVREDLELNKCYGMIELLVFMAQYRGRELRVTRVQQVKDDQGNYIIYQLDGKCYWDETMLEPVGRNKRKGG